MNNNKPVYSCFGFPLLVFLMVFAVNAGAQTISSADTILTAADKDTFILKKADYHIIAAHYPELLYTDYPTQPRLLYAARDGGDDYIFDSEAGYDFYCEVYAFFLKQRNGIEKYVSIRDTMNRLYNNLNLFLGGLGCGGNYYAHMERRVAAYAEYSVYLRSLYTTQEPYRIDLQKKHYIALLRQIVADEMKVDDDMVDCDAGRKHELIKRIEEIDHLITDKFLLEQALIFQAGMAADF